MWLEKENLLRIEGWAKDGLTDEQIAKNMGISRGTIYDWKKNHSDISNALKRGKEVVDREVENALEKAAVGYWVEETKTYIEEVDGRKKKKIEKNKKWIPANTTAQIYWLKNRKPEQWRDKRELQDVTQEERVSEYLKVLGDTIDED